MPELHVVDHPLVAHKLTQMRRDTTSSERFRRLLTETSLLLTYEVTRELALRDVRITTPLTKTDQPELVAEPVVISILRAGNGLLDGVLQVLPSARVGHALRGTFWYFQKSDNGADPFFFVHKHAPFLYLIR